jgi:hypothetical protein
MKRWNNWNKSFWWYSMELVMGWISIFKVAFKPVATIMQKQESLDNQGNITK